MSPITILQSAPADTPAWIARCMTSVRQWADLHGYEYRVSGDELFDTISPDLRKKLAGRTPILADLARLDWITSVLLERGGLAVWIDADTVVLHAPWQIPIDAHTVFGEECWIQKDEDARWRAYLSPHNAFMGFSESSPVLPFLKYLSKSIIERADPQFIAPQMIGPKLLKALHSLANFRLLPEAGALSPPLLAEWVGAHAAAMACYERADRPPLAMANLCSSLASVADHHENIERLLQHVLLP